MDSRLSECFAHFGFCKVSSRLLQSVRGATAWNKHIEAEQLVRGLSRRRPGFNSRSRSYATSNIPANNVQKRKKTRSANRRKTKTSNLNNILGWSRGLRRRGSNRIFVGHGTRSCRGPDIGSRHGEAPLAQQSVPCIPAVPCSTVHRSASPVA